MAREGHRHAQLWLEHRLPHTGKRRSIGERIASFIFGDRNRAALMLAGGLLVAAIAVLSSQSLFGATWRDAWVPNVVTTLIGSAVIILAVDVAIDGRNRTIRDERDYVRLIPLSDVVSDDLRKTYSTAVDLFIDTLVGAIDESHLVTAAEVGRTLRANRTKWKPDTENMRLARLWLSCAQLLDPAATFTNRSPRLAPYSTTVESCADRLARDAERVIRSCDRLLLLATTEGVVNIDQQVAVVELARFFSYVRDRAVAAADDRSAWATAWGPFSQVALDEAGNLLDEATLRDRVDLFGLEGSQSNHPGGSLLDATKRFWGGISDEYVFYAAAGTWVQAAVHGGPTPLMES
jgi:hypothetical protein